jgi:hypothetical protein
MNSFTGVECQCSPESGLNLHYPENHLISSYINIAEVYVSWRNTGVLHCGDHGTGTASSAHVLHPRTSVYNTEGAMVEELVHWADLNFDAVA